MSIEQNKRMTARVFEEAFNRGELAVIDEAIAADAVDHQDPNEPSFRQHLKNVVCAMRTAFPDLHFEITQMIGEGDWVALHSVMTGTNTGELLQPLLPSSGRVAVPPTGRPIRVAHMYLLRFAVGRNAELWHLMDTFALLGQLGLMPDAAPVQAGR